MQKFLGGRAVWLSLLLILILLAGWIFAVHSPVGWVELAGILCVAGAGGIVGILRYGRGVAIARTRETRTIGNVVARNLQEDLRKQEERLRLVVEGTNDGIWDWEIASGKVYWSKRANELLGLDEQGLGDSWKKLKEHMKADQVRALDSALDQHLRGGCPSIYLEMEAWNKSGSPVVLLLRGKAQVSAHGHAVRAAGSVSDITELKKAERGRRDAEERHRKVELELRKAGEVDSLTGLANRSAFVRELELSIDSGRRRKDQFFALLVMDMDKFGSINDHFGHRAGDEVLKYVADVLRSCCRADDVIARIGGDEFGVVFADIRGGDAEIVTRRIQQELSESFEVDLGEDNKVEVYVSASMGLVINAGDFEDSKGMLATADGLVKKAKMKGLGQMETSREVGKVPVSEQLIQINRELKRDLASVSTESTPSPAALQILKHTADIAVDHPGLSLRYQPIVDIATETPVGFEALVRWKRSDGYMPPSVFIPIAEKTGAIALLGQWVLDQACDQTRIWVESGFDKITVAVNFSARQFQQQDLVNTVKRVLDRTKLDDGRTLASNLKLEITESIAMADAEKTIATLQALEKVGLQISMDDFGTGYSSLSYLRRYPIHTLKIDKSFVDGIPFSRTGREGAEELVKAIIEMAKQLKLRIIAEGVETKDQMEFLKIAGCHMIQGYYYSRPLTPEDATEYLKQHLSRSQAPAENLQ